MISTAIDGYPLADREQDWPPLPEQEHRPLHRAVLAALGPLDGQRLLDVGCGVGLFLRAAEQRGALVAGTDTAVERLEIARWALPDADLRVGGLVEPGDALPFDNGTFDVVTAGTSVHDGADRAAVLTELARVVRPRWPGRGRRLGPTVRLLGGDVRGPPAPARAAARRRPAPTTALDGALRAAGLTVLADGDVHFTRRPTRASAPRGPRCSAASRSCVPSGWRGRHPVRAAFAASVAGAVAADGTVRLPKAFRYAVATTPVSTMWAPVPELDNESGSVSERP